MVIKEMTKKECLEFLTVADVGRLGCARDNKPYVVPIYFAYEPDHLYGFSTVGQKIEWMRSNPQVCVEVDEITNYFRWTSVIISGRYAELSDTPEYGPERSQAEKLLQKRFLWWQTAHAATQTRPQNKTSPHLFYRIQIDELTGHRAVPDPADSERAGDDEQRALLSLNHAG
jgi:nitroimidazol reductase NimA-like FMN-containing flavoprotein (pyridoxamine 5'-phosphate oxidase superfamily)